MIRLFENWDLDVLLDFVMPKIEGMLFFFHLEKHAGWERDGRKIWEHFLKNYERYQSVPLPSYPIILCFNFYDFLEDHIGECFDPEEFNKEVNLHNWPYFATSGKTGKNIEAAYRTLISKIVANRQSQETAIS